MLETIKALWWFFDRQMRLKIIGMIVLMIGMAGLEATGVGLIVPIIQLLSDADTAMKNEWVVSFRKLLGQPSFDIFLLECLFGLLFFYILKNVASFIFLILQLRLTWNNAARMTLRLFEVYFRVPLAFHLQRNSASIVRNMTQSVTQAYQGALNPLMALMAEAFVAMAIITLLFITEPIATTIVCGVLGIVTYSFLRLVRNQVTVLGEEKHWLNAEILKSLNQSMASISEIKLLGREAFFANAVGRLQWGISRLNIRQSLVVNSFRPVLEVMAVSAILGTVMIIFQQGRELKDVLPILGLFTVAAFRLLPSFNRIANLTNDVLFSAPGIREIQNDLSLDPGLDTLAKPVGEAMHLQDKFQLSKVSFRYESSEAETLNSISLDIRRGEAVALVGRSGAGKSTLANIILGLLTPQDGAIYFDGENVTDRRRKWRGAVGFVPQDTYLTDDTIRRNIAFGLEDADIDSRLLNSTVEKAQLKSFIEELPEGLDTIVGERGLRLSGGQKQRVAIARALYNDPDILVLDEATSALDAETEAAITEAINALRGEKTLIIIAHRISTVKDCDCLYWMENGQITDFGAFADLAARNDDFMNMVRHLDLSSSLNTEITDDLSI